MGWKLHDTDFVTPKIAHKTSGAVGWYAAFARTDGRNAEIDLESRTSKDFDLKMTPCAEERRFFPKPTVVLGCAPRLVRTLLTSIIHCIRDWSGITKMGPFPVP